MVEADDLRTGLHQTIVAMITSNLARRGHPSRFEVLRSSALGRRMGLLLDSVIMTDNLATVREIEVDRVVGNCDDMQAVDEALRHTLGI